VSNNPFTLEHFRVKTLLRTVAVSPSNQEEEMLESNLLHSQCKQLVTRIYDDHTDRLLFFFCFTKKLNYVKKNCSPGILWKDKKVDPNEYLGVKLNFRLGNLVVILGIPGYLNLAVPWLRFMKFGPSTA